MDSDYAASAPFKHNEIPAVYFVDGTRFGYDNTNSTTVTNTSFLSKSYDDILRAATTKFSPDTLEAYTDKAIGQTTLLASFFEFFDQRVHDIIQTAKVVPKKFASDVTLIRQNAELRQQSASKVLGILAEHPGRELEVLESDFKDAPVTAFVRAEMNRVKKGKKPNPMLIAAEFFDNVTVNAK